MNAVDGISLTVDDAGVGHVGEFSSGKSVTMMALMGLVASSGRVPTNCSFAGHDLLSRKLRASSALTGKDVAISRSPPPRNPCHRRFSTMENPASALVIDGKVGNESAPSEPLNRWGINSPESRLTTHTSLSLGGMNQRVMIAMAIACNSAPIADEPHYRTGFQPSRNLTLLRSLQKNAAWRWKIDHPQHGVVSGNGSELP
jgi:dipeptide transport system ATP-binding protein